MFKINDNFLKLPGSYLFSTIARKVSEYKAANPDREVISLGIGDVTQPLAPAVVKALPHQEPSARLLIRRIFKTISNRTTAIKRLYLNREKSM